MADDFTADTSTTGKITVNSQAHVTGNLEAGGDHDWFKVWLWSGETYVIQEIGNRTDNNLTLPDAVVSIHNQAGLALASNDQGGFINDAYLRFVAPSSGFYFVDAAAFDPAQTGTYDVSVTEQADRLGSPHLWGTGATNTDQLGDFNRDGKQDLLQITADGTIKVSLASESGFGPTGTTGEAHGFTTWGSGGTPSDRIGDFNGDGRQDILQIYNGNAYVDLSNGTGTAFVGFGPAWLTGGVSASAHIVDISGGGGTHRQDLVQVNADGTVSVAISTGTTFQPFVVSNVGGALPTDQISPTVTFNGSVSTDVVNPGSDFNGDGKPDLLQLYNGQAFVALANGAGNGFLPYTSWLGGGTTASDRYGDVNGDHKADLIQIYNGSVFVALANTAGTAFNNFTQWVAGATASDQIIDMNGDNKADLYQVFGGKAYVALSDGTEFAPYAVWADNVGSTDRLADVSGDGLPDNVQTFNGSVYVWQSISVPGNDLHQIIL